MEPARKADKIDPATMPPVAQQPISGSASNQDSGCVPGRLKAVTFTPTVYTSWVKPAADRVTAGAALFVLLPPLLLLAGIVLITMGRPILFRQRRVGLHGKTFNVLKFRTMDPDRRLREVSVLHEKRVTHKSENDPRHTPVGRFMRSLSLDELPQLINILRGDMSIVGPRPELESVVKTQYPENLDRRHLVRPGLTGLWQISARGTGPMHENGQWDLEYVEKISLWTDLRIICKTPFVIFSRNRGQ